MSEKKLIPFTIEKLDGMGQGVSRQTGKVTFIAKTLPDEKGLARIGLEKKSHQFAELIELTHPSQQRLDPVCPHFQLCGGCHFLHTTYEFELQLKKQSLSELMAHAALNTDSLQVIAPKQRLGHRNRIQLHYHAPSKKLGYFLPKSNQILEVPRCQLPTPAIQKALSELYSHPAELWEKIKTDGKTEGLVELAQDSNAQEVNLHLDQGRSVGGFTQVNQEINRELQNLIKKIVEQHKIQHLLDLFGGNGNLSKSLSIESTVIDNHIDQDQLRPHQRSVEGDLYSLDFFQNSLIALAKSLDRPLGVVIDPPRSGWNFLAEFLKQVDPDFLLIVACDPQTLVRDLSSIKNFAPIRELYLLDMFPATFHFETLVFLSRRHS